MSIPQVHAKIHVYVMFHTNNVSYFKMFFSTKIMIKNKVFPLSFSNGFIQIKSEVKTRKLNTKGLLCSLILPGHLQFSQTGYYSNSKSNNFP